MLSKNDCPIINGATKCPIAWFDKYEKISPVEVSNYLYFIAVINKLNKKNQLEVLSNMC